MAGDEDTLLDSTEEPARGRNEEQEQHRASRLLLPRRVVSPIRGIALRLGVALSCLVITTALVWFGRDGYTDSADGEVSLLDALYYATVTLSTTGYGDISPVSDSARLINVLIITPLRFLFLIVLVGTVLETLAERTRLEWRQQKWKEKKMDGHTVVVGFGVKGRAAAQAMVDAGSSPDRVVVITPDAESASDARRMGIAVVLGDARREEVLLDAGVDRASSIIVATDSDDTSVLVTLTVKRLMPGTAKIVSAARESANAQVLRDSGAQGVIVTAEAAGRLLALQLQSPHAGDLWRTCWTPAADWNSSSGRWDARSLASARWNWRRPARSCWP